MGQHAQLLRETTDRVHAMGAGWWEQGNDQCRFGKNRERSRHNHLSARAGMAAASIPSDAPHSRHVIARAFGGKYGGAENTAQSGKVEDD